MTDRDEFIRSRDRRRDAARRSLERLIDDATNALAALDDGTIRTTIAGAVLDAQAFMDAERNLVRWHDAAGVVAMLEEGS